MARRARQSGFSLIEVVFALAILTMGLVFVASQFPIGLLSSREVAETTVQAVESQNAAKLLELNLRRSGTNGILANTDNLVHFLPRPNVLPGRVNPGAPWSNDWTLILDCPEHQMTIPRTLFWTSVLAPTYFVQPTLPGTPFYGSFHNFGNIMLPEVSSYDRDVLKLCNESGFNLPPTTNAAALQWQRNILSLGLERNYSWCAFYQFLGDGKFRFIVVTLRNSNRESLFARQKYYTGGTIPGLGVSLGLPLPVPAPIVNWYDMDRRLPVPWGIALNDGIPGGIDRFRIYDSTYRPNNLELETHLLPLLQEGSIIIDNGWNPSGIAQMGTVYKVIELSQEDSSSSNPNPTSYIRLDKPLAAPLFKFWVMPPAIEPGSPRPNTINDPDTAEFGPVQPVMGVAEFEIKF